MPLRWAAASSVTADTDLSGRRQRSLDAGEPGDWQISLIKGTIFEAEPPNRLARSLRKAVFPQLMGWRAESAFNLSNER
ncbi:MAG: hypothetical protein ACFB12_28125 [Leptolyngbyaceae cyanobacterium]